MASWTSSCPLALHALVGWWSLLERCEGPTCSLQRLLLPLFRETLGRLITLGASQSLSVNWASWCTWDPPYIRGLRSQWGSCPAHSLWPVVTWAQFHSLWHGNLGSGSWDLMFQTAQVASKLLSQPCPPSLRSPHHAPCSWSPTCPGLWGKPLSAPLASWQGSHSVRCVLHACLQCKNFLNFFDFISVSIL